MAKKRSIKKKGVPARKTSAGRKALIGGAAAITLLIGVPAFAATTEPNPSSSAVHAAHDRMQIGHQKITNAAFGTVQSVNGSVVTLSHRTKSGIANITVTTTASTTYKKNGQTDTVSDIAVGDRIVAMGIKDTEGNITNATTVNIFAPL